MKWVLILFCFALSACSFGAYVQPLQEGSKFDVSYQKNRYHNIKSGMQYMDGLEEQEVEASSKKEWDSWK